MCTVLGMRTALIGHKNFHHGGKVHLHGDVCLWMERGERREREIFENSINKSIIWGLEMDLFVLYGSIFIAF